MKSFNKKLLIVFLIFITAVFSSPGFISSKTHNSSEPVKLKSQFREEMRKLWEDHIVWTRNLIFNVIDGAGGDEQAVARLRRNADEIGNAFKPYYGEVAAKKLSDLIDKHNTNTDELLRAAKSNDAHSLEEANEELHENADDIANYLSGTNPNWAKNDLTSMLYSHIGFTIDEAMSRLKKDYFADVKAYDNVHDSILLMSDILARGIIKQFPEMFKTVKKKKGF